MNVSVIIPTLDESCVLGRTLSSMQRNRPHEIIVADGGSADDTLDIARKFNVSIVSSSPGKALQMNVGAREATGDLLLFLHADCDLGPEGYQKMLNAMERDGFVGGAFSLSIESDHWSLRLISYLANLRSKSLHLVYGDQAIFVRSSAFNKVGGYSPLPICEDLDFFRKIRKLGKMALLDEKASVSPRRWLAEGIVFTTFRNTVIAGLFLLGFPARILSKWYLPVR